MSKRTHPLFWRRVLAYLIDLCSMLPCVWVVFFYDNRRNLDEVQWMTFFAGILYLLIKDGLPGGRSIGKWFLKLKVIDLNTDVPIGFAKSLWRNFLFLFYSLSVFAVSSFVLRLIDELVDGPMSSANSYTGGSPSFIVDLMFLVGYVFVLRIGLFDVVKACRSQVGLKNSDLHSKTKVVEMSYKPELVRSSFGWTKKISLPVQVEINISREGEMKNAESTSVKPDGAEKESPLNRKQDDDSRFRLSEKIEEKLESEVAADNRSGAGLSGCTKMQDDRRFMPPEMRDSLSLSQSRNMTVTHSSSELEPSDNQVDDRICNQPLARDKKERNVDVNENQPQEKEVDKRNSAIGWAIGAVLLICFIVLAGIMGEKNRREKMFLVNPSSYKEAQNQYDKSPGAGVPKQATNSSPSTLPHDDQEKLKLIVDDFNEFTGAFRSDTTRAKGIEIISEKITEKNTVEVFQSLGYSKKQAEKGCDVYKRIFSKGLNELLSDKEVCFLGASILTKGRLSAGGSLVNKLNNTMGNVNVVSFMTKIEQLQENVMLETAREMVSFQDEAQSRPQETVSDSWETVVWKDRWSFKLPPSLEVQGGEYQSYMQKAYKSLGKGFLVNESLNRVVVQPKGINKFEEGAIKHYCRFIVETMSSELRGGDEKYHDIHPTALSDKAISILNEGFFEAQKEEEERQRRMGIPFEMIEWYPVKVTKFESFSAIEYGFLRKSTAEGKANVLVNYYIVEGGRTDYKITASYRVDEENLWKEPLNQMLNSFQLGNATGLATELNVKDF